MKWNTIHFFYFAIETYLTSIYGIYRRGASYPDGEFSKRTPGETSKLPIKNKRRHQIFTIFTWRKCILKLNKTGHPCRVLPMYRNRYALRLVWTRKYRTRGVQRYTMKKKKKKKKRCRKKKGSIDRNGRWIFAFSNRFGMCSTACFLVKIRLMIREKI